MAPAPGVQIVTVDLTTLREIVQDAVREVVRSEVSRMQAPDSDQLLDAKAAARLIGCSENAIRVKTNRGGLPSVTNGRSRRWRKSDLLAAWSEQT